MTLSKTPPTEPGLYRWHDGRGKVIEYAVYYPMNRVGNLFAFNPAEAEHSKYVDKITTGYWERINLGEPYIAPEPPVVELWEGTIGSDRRFIVRTAGLFWAFDMNGKLRGRESGGLDVSDYTNLRKVGEYVLQEEA